MGGFADYYGQTNLHPLALMAVLILGLLALGIPRRFALVPLLLAATTTPMAQRLVIAGADFTLLRLLLLAYLLRIILRGEMRGLGWNRLDTTVLLWTIIGTAIMTIRYGDVATLINRLGWSYDILLTYFVVRFLVREWGDVISLSRFSAILSVPIAGFFLVEWVTQLNIFSVFGGVPEVTRIREGRLRCQGPFAHPIIAGTFWASMMPLIWVQFREGWWSWWLVVIGTAASVLVIAASASSTPLLSAAAAVAGVCLFPFRHYRRSMWVGFFLTLAILHFFIMNNPVWHLIARVDAVGGSQGWHRFVILDTFINNFSDWYLVGESNPRRWRWQMRDITNEYVGQGLNGGLLTLVAFVMVLVYAFANVGRALSILEGKAGEVSAKTENMEWRVWLIGIAVFVHSITFLGLGYFGQMSALWYFQLGLAGCVGASLLQLTDHKAPVEKGSQRDSRFNQSGRRIPERQLTR